MADFKKLITELRRRKVVRVSVVYVLVAWLLLQVAEVTFEPLSLPPWSLTLVIWLAILGFPIAAALAWAFEVTPAGVKRDPADVPAEETERTPDEPPSVAVLPFVDMSENHDQAYFCEGVAEEILNALTRATGLRVAARTSSFLYRGEEADIQRIGRDLGVDAILEGSVRKSGNQLRITAQLVKATDGFHLWSERYDREMADIFAIQDEIATNITAALKGTLTPSEAQALQTPQADIEAYDYYLKGWSYFHRFGPKNISYARDLFTRALEIDPEFGRAWAGLADADAFLYMYYEARSEYRDEADEASRKAVELCPQYSETHASRGLAQVLFGNWGKAEAHFRAALAIDPNDFEASYFFARACVTQGKHAQAAELFERAAEIDPNDYQSVLLTVQEYRALGDTEAELDAARRGVDRARRHLELNPDDVRALYLSAGALHRLGEVEAGRELAERCTSLDPDDPSVLYNLACYYAVAGEGDKAMDLLERVDLPAMANRHWVEHDEDLASLRGTARFRALVAQLKD